MPLFKDIAKGAKGAVKGVKKADKFAKSKLKAGAPGRYIARTAKSVTGNVGKAVSAEARNYASETGKHVRRISRPVKSWAKGAGGRGKKMAGWAAAAGTYVGGDLELLHPNKSVVEKRRDAAAKARTRRPSGTNTFNRSPAPAEPRTTSAAPVPSTPAKVKLGTSHSSRYAETIKRRKAGYIMLPDYEK